MKRRPTYPSSSSSRSPASATPAGRPPSASSRRAVIATSLPRSRLRVVCLVVELALGDASKPLATYAHVVELISETTERARALVVKGKNASQFVVQAQLVALIEHAFCERLPFPRRVASARRDDFAPPTSDGDGADASSGGGGGEFDLWEKAMYGMADDPKFKMVTQRSVLQKLKELLQTYLVACIVQVRSTKHGAPNRTERTTADNVDPSAQRFDAREGMSWSRPARGFFGRDGSISIQRRR